MMGSLGSCQREDMEGENEDDQIDRPLEEREN